MIVYSHDSGKTWQQGQYGTAPERQAAGFLMKSAWAGGNPPPRPANTSPEQTALPTSTAITPVPSSGNAPADADPKQAAPAASTDKPKPEPAKKPLQQRNLWAVYFTDSQHGWAVGEQGTLLSSSDGGAYWQEQDSHTQESLRAIFFLPDGLRGWVAGDGGTILATLDGGKSWQTQHDGSEVLVALLFQADGLHGWAFSFNGSALVTEDGGKTWRLNEKIHLKLWATHQFLPDGHGWTAGDSGDIQTTTDFGEHWQKQTSPTKKGLKAVHFQADGRRGWIVGNEGTLLTTKDGGKHWQEIRATGTTLALQAVGFDQNGLQGWAVGTGGTLIASEDGGQHWLHQSGGGKADTIALQFLANGQRGWRVGGDGTILSSHDGGIHWTPQTSGTANHLFAVQFLSDSLHGWAVGYQGTILSTGDGGVQWAKQDSKTNAWLWGLQFLEDGKQGWTVGEDGTILATADGGAHWQVQDSTTKNGLYALHFLADGTRGWAAGGDGTLLSTADGGNTWQALASKTSQTLWAIQFLSDGQRGWAAGEGGTVITTTDSGKTWAAQTSGTQAWLQHLFFLADGQHGWAAGNHGTLLTTADGGKNWQLQPNQMTEELFTIQFLADGLRGWAAGYNGAFLATDNGGTTWSDPTAPYRRYPPPLFGFGLLLLALGAGGLAWQRQPDPTATGQDSANPHAAKPPGTFISDHPEESLARDELDFKPVVLSLVDFLSNPATLPPLTFAIIGKWGSGKSSLMGMLKSELQAKGFCPVWFNAWHHQQEQHYLESLLPYIRHEGAGDFWSWRGLGIRLGLAAKSHWLMQGVVLALLGATLFLAAHIAHNISYEAAKDYVFFQLGWQQPLVFTAHAFEPHCEAVISDKSQPTTARTVERKSSHTAPCQDQEPTLLPGFKVDHMNWLRDHAVWRSSGCAFKPDPAQPNPNEDHRCFFHTQKQLLDSLADALKNQYPTDFGKRLTREQEASLLKVAEHVDPDNPFEQMQIFFKGLLLAGSLFFLSLLQSMALFGWQVGDLTGWLGKRLALSQGNEPTGSRQRYTPELEKLADVFKKRLVLFIDDLDRCEQGQVMRMLETINFLVSHRGRHGGGCFVVMGMDPDYVQGCIALSYKDLAAEIHDEQDPPSPAKEGGTPTADTIGKQRRAEFAQEYLEKLVNMKIPLPTLQAKQAEKVVTKTEIPSIVLWTKQHPWLLTLLALALMGSSSFWYGYKGENGLLDPPHALVLDQQALVPKDHSAEAKPATGPEPTQPKEKDAEKGLSGGDGGKFKGSESGVDGAIYAGLAGGGLVLLLGIGLLHLWRNPHNQKHLPPWLKKAFKRLGEATQEQLTPLVGPKEIPDSEDFKYALKLWLPVWVARQNTPRSAKRFANWARYLAMNLPYQESFKDYFKAKTRNAKTRNAENPKIKNRNAKAYKTKAYKTKAHKAEAHLVAWLVAEQIRQSDGEELFKNFEDLLFDESSKPTKSATTHFRSALWNAIEGYDEEIREKGKKPVRRKVPGHRDSFGWPPDKDLLKRFEKLWGERED